VSTPHAQLSPPPEASRQTYPFALADLPYSYDALEPHIDQKTLQVHHRGHHATYVKKLNEVVSKRPELHRLTLAELLRDLDKVPADIRTAVKPQPRFLLERARAGKIRAAGRARGRVVEAVQIVR
jgi:Fe-Mn family superoxide dismutase